MCSLTFLRSKIKFSNQELEKANFLQQFRGPDFTKIINIDDDYDFKITLIHNLLDISGTFSIQPKIIYDLDGSTLGYLIFNGEIYNYNNEIYSSDTDFLVSKFSQFQNNFKPDGEFAIVFYEVKSSTLHIFTDPFLTKPLYFSTADDSSFGLSSYASTLRNLNFHKIELFEPNSYYQIIFSVHDTKIRKIEDIFHFSTNQNVDTFNAWEQSFLNSVKKRALHGHAIPYVNLSSGYDSGAICLALNLLKIPYYTLSISAGESYSILRSRIKFNKNSSCQAYWLFDGLSKKEISQIKTDINNFVEPFTYVHEDAPGTYNTLQNDSGAIGLAYLASQAQKKGFRVSLSGAGADEIISDYGFNGKKIYYHSEFGGKFPEKLENFFPWKKFYSDTQRSYLFKEEFILGRYSIEGRYPFLDSELVQSFLSLNFNLKNIEYKAPISQFLKKYNYPFEQDKKRGFIANKDKLKNRLLNLLFK